MNDRQTYNHQLLLIGAACLLVHVGCGGSGGAHGAITDATTDTLPDAATARFSFFVTSLQAMRRLSNNDNGFGGDLRFGETGPGAGLRGADKICSTIAEASSAGAGQRPWRAFLSVVAGDTGTQVNAIDRIGEGPWYDRLGRIVASQKTDLLHDRPSGGDSAIQDDLPNENGVPNHAPDPSQNPVNNRSILTGSDVQGGLYDITSTCQDWTSASSTAGQPRAGYSWSEPSDAGTTTGIGPGFLPDGGFSAWLDGGFVPSLDGGFPPWFGLDGGVAPLPDGGVPPGFALDGGLPDGLRPDGLSPGGSGTAADNWISAADLGGCAPGVNVAAAATQPDSSVASNGGYGGIYCFALTP